MSVIACEKGKFADWNFVIPIPKRGCKTAHHFRRRDEKGQAVKAHDALEGFDVVFGVHAVIGVDVTRVRKGIFLLITNGAFFRDIFIGQNESRFLSTGFGTPNTFIIPRDVSLYASLSKYACACARTSARLTL